MLTLRLQRAGKRNSVLYRVVVAQKASAAGKKFVEILGSYNPHTKNLVMKEDRLKYWTAQRIELSPTVNNLLVTKKLIDGKKTHAFALPKKEVKAESVVETKTEIKEEAAA